MWLGIGTKNSYWGLRLNIEIRICYSQIKLCIMRIGIKAWNFYLEIELWDWDEDWAMVIRDGDWFLGRF